VKQQLWGGEFWSDGYFVSRVGKHGDEGMICRYVKEQGKEYLRLHQDRQLIPISYEVALNTALTIKSQPVKERTISVVS
jgi:putative transposase